MSSSQRFATLSRLARIPALWLVIGGPGLVVVASFITLALALHGADRPLQRDTGAADSTAQAMTPATQARNHAAAPQH